MKFNISQNAQYSEVPAIPGAPRLMRSITPLRDTFEQVEADLTKSADAVNELFSRFCGEAMKLLPTEFKAVDAKLAELSAERATIEKKIGSINFEVTDELTFLLGITKAQTALFGKGLSDEEIIASGDLVTIAGLHHVVTDLGDTVRAKNIRSSQIDLLVPGCRARLAEIAELERVLRSEVQRAVFEFLQSAGRVVCPSLSNAQNPAAAFVVEVSHG